MKKHLFTVAAATLALSLASCDKKDDPIPTKLQGYFYTPDSTSSEKPLTLYMDGVKKGYLPYIKASYDRPLDFADPVLKSTALQFEFMSGTHRFESRDAEGKVVSSTTMSFDYYKNGTSGSATSSVGGAGSSSTGTTAVVWLTR
ncbi:MAG: hypothetical protein JNL13_03065 [Chitinophagaceae bacterium]|nr:hypothetical protein [Chitinophagaceae bacterium]